MNNNYNKNNDSSRQQLLQPSIQEEIIESLRCVRMDAEEEQFEQWKKQADESSDAEKTCPDCDSLLERLYDGWGKLKYYCDNCDEDFGIPYYISQGF